MSTETKKTDIVTKVKGLLGVEDDVKLKPMIAYNSAIFFSGGGPYVLGCYLLPFLTKVEGLSTAQYGTVALFSCICDAITDPLMVLLPTEHGIKTADTDPISSGVFCLH